MHHEKLLIIGGGVGPMAGVALHAAIIENTLAGGDRGHLDLIHLSLSAGISDRTEFLLGRDAENPAAGMAAGLALVLAGISGREAVIGVPCNTFHAPEIFGPFVQEALRMGAAAGLKLTILDMLDETLGFLASIAPDAIRIGLMTTTGTRRSGVYDRLLTKAGMVPLYVAEEEQDLLHAAIYDPVWGIKASGRPLAKAVEVLRGLALRLAEKGAQAIVLGCTELPLALTEKHIYAIPLVDPVLALARALIREAAPAKLAPLSPAIRA
jgi:aspartate racemase